jgi:hypothetical protein
MRFRNAMRFRAAVESALPVLVSPPGRLVGYDLAVYNHRRGGPSADFGVAQRHLQMNPGPGAEERPHGSFPDGSLPWAISTHACIRGVTWTSERTSESWNFRGGGGSLASRFHNLISETASVLSREFKMFFMDECSGEAAPWESKTILAALSATDPGAWLELKRL